jgi:hypothetical protein
VDLAESEVPVGWPARTNLGVLYGAVPNTKRDEGVWSNLCWVVYDQTRSYSQTSSLVIWRAYEAWSVNYPALVPR